MAMVSRITATAVNVNDAELVAAFWRAALGWHEHERDDTVISIGPADDPLTGLDVVRVSESKMVKSRLHYFDLRADGASRMPSCSGCSTSGSAVSRSVKVQTSRGSC
jgi:hypothetical protein